jgi:hypothetical protein
VATTRLITGRRITARTVRDQHGLSVRLAARPKNGIGRALTRSPSRLSSAGSSVSAAATETSATTIAAAARLRMTVLDTSSNPARKWRDPDSNRGHHDSQKAVLRPLNPQKFL